MMNEKISIIIPVYNLEDYIGKCLDSVLEQTYHNLEIIVVDDGSKDNSLQILKKYAKNDSRIKILSKENGGVTSARLLGVKEATGEYIGFVDGDDYIEPEMFGRLLANAKKYQVDISHCGYQMVFPNGHVNYYYNTGKIIRQDNYVGIKDLLTGEFVEPGLWNKLFVKKIFEDIIKYDLLDLTIKINEDLLMNYYLFKAAKNMVYEDICPYHYLLRKNSAATAKINMNKITDPIKVLKTILEDIEENTMLKDIIWTRLFRQYIFAVTIPSKGEENIVTYKKKAKKELRDMLLDTQLIKRLDKKMIGMAFLAAYAPGIYRGVHCLYSRIKGTDKKYVVE